MLEQQSEEREALQSIYEGDGAFKEISPTTFQYRYGKEDECKSFLVEIVWKEDYPSQLPTINLDTFYNRHITPIVKEKIHGALLAEAEQWLGCGMTYTLFEYIKDHMDDLIAEQPNVTTARQLIELDGAVHESPLKIAHEDDSKKKEIKKDKLTKSQKRRQWDRTDQKGDHVRGWNWVDIIKHLSQSGTKENQPSVMSEATILPNTNI